MTKKEAIKVLWESLEFLENTLGKANIKLNRPYLSPIMQALGMAIEALNQKPLPISEYWGDWIPTNEALPNVGDHVLVTKRERIYPAKNNFGNFRPADYNYIKVQQLLRHSNWDAEYDSVIAWMPLPAPFEPQESEEQA